MSTTSVTKPADIIRTWHLFDAKNKILGRLSTEIAGLLIGKNKPFYAANVDCGDYIVVINAKDVQVTGTKASSKLYRHHTGHPGGFREFTYKQVAAKDPREIIIHSVKGMLPKNRLRDQRIARLKVFADGKHPYAQMFQPEPEITVKSIDSQKEK